MLRLVAFVVLVAACGSSGERAVPVEVQVESGHTILAGKDVSRLIDDKTVEAVRARREVLSVLPRADLRGPASGSMKVDGNDVRFEVGGFVDGIPPETLADQPELRARFEAPGAVPILISPTLVELYNTSFAPSRGLPLMDITMLELMSKRGTLHATIDLGVSTVDAVFVGVSPHARPIGFTVPIAAIQDWNRQLGATGSRYSALDVTLRSVSSIEPFTRWMTDEGYSVSDSFRMSPRP